MLTAIDMYWIHLPIFPSRVSHCIFWTSSLLNFSTPSFCRLCSNVDTRTSLQPQMTPPCSWLNKGKLDDLNHSVMCWVLLHPEKIPCQGEEFNWPGFSSLDNWSSSWSTQWFNHTKSFSIKVFTVDHHAPKSSDHNKAPMSESCTRSSLCMKHCLIAGFKELYIQLSMKGVWEFVQKHDMPVAQLVQQTSGQDD